MDIQDLQKALTWNVDKTGGEYKDYPVRITYYYNGKRVWTDDYFDEISDEQKIREFQQAMGEGLVNIKEGE